MAVGAFTEDHRLQLLHGMTHVGLQPKESRGRDWLYEQCVFAEGVIGSAELARVLEPGAPRVLRVSGVDFQLELCDSAVRWERKPSNARFDEPKVPWPTRTYFPTLKLESPSPQPPPGFLVGKSDTPSFPVFSAAFKAFFTGEYTVVNSQIPSLGTLIVRVIDDAGRILNIELIGQSLKVGIGGRALSGSQLELNSQTFHKSLSLNNPGIYTFEIPGDSAPLDSWVWMKRDGDWIDYRNLQPWGGYVSSDVQLGDDVPTKMGQDDDSSGRSVDIPFRKRVDDYARRALVSFVGGSHHDFFLFAGLTVELAIKAKIAQVTLVYLAPKNDFQSTMALWTAHEDVGRLPPGVRTIGGKDAVDRMIQVHPSLIEIKTLAEELLEHRNGEVHLGVASAQQMNGALVAFVRILTVLLDVTSEYWGQHAELVRSLVDENALRVQREVQLKISQAIERFNQIKQLDESQRQVLLELLSHEVDDHDFEESPVSCPACGSRALSYGTFEIEVGSPDFDREGSVEGIPSWLWFSPTSLRCGICRLHLEGQEELGVAGIDSSWRIDDPEAIRAFYDAESRSYEYYVGTADDSEEVEHREE